MCYKYKMNKLVNGGKVVRSWQDVHVFHVVCICTVYIYTVLVLPIKLSHLKRYEIVQSVTVTEIRRATDAIR